MGLLLFLVGLHVALGAHGWKPPDPLLIPTPWNRNEWPDPNPPALYTLTYTNRIGLLDCFSLHTAVHHGYVPNILGYFEALAFSKRQHLNEDKFNAMIRALEWLADREPDAVVLFADSSDVIFQLGPSVLMERYLNHEDSPIFLGAEVTCYPLLDYCGLGEPWVGEAVRATGVRSLYPNTGTYVGRAAALRRIMQGCYWKKVDTLHRKAPIEASIFPNESGEDQVMAYYWLNFCGLEPVPRPDYFQDLFGLVGGQEALFQFSSRGLWERVGDSLPQSSVGRALAAVDSVHAARALAPVLVHYNSASKYMNDTFMRHADRSLRHENAAPYQGTADGQATVNLVRYRTALFGEICRTYLAGEDMEYYVPKYMYELGLMSKEQAVAPGDKGGQHVPG